MSDTNCPNCAAPITGPKCEYCGTVFNLPEIDRTNLYVDNRLVLTLCNVCTPNEIRKVIGLKEI